MKVFHLLPFVLVGNCAIPTPADGDTTSAVEANVDNHSTVNDTVITLDVPSEAPSPDIENETPNCTTPENLSRISIRISEYCDDGVLKASGWLSNGQVKFELHLNAEQVTKINLHPGYDQLVGPYDFASHTFDIEYGGCKWSSEGGSPCGWCEVQPWTLEPLNCQTGHPEDQRSTHRTCYFTSPLHNPSAQNLQPTKTPPPTPSLPSETLVTIQASTVTLHPLIIQTVLPATPPDHLSTILPFHLQIQESCLPSTPLLASALYRNGNMAIPFSLGPGHVARIQHLIPGYADLEVGPYGYQGSSVGFRYQRPGSLGGGGCGWGDGETWRECGECRAGLWSAGVLDCGRGGVRWTEMDCSVLLGVGVV